MQKLLEKYLNAASFMRVDGLGNFVTAALFVQANGTFTVQAHDGTKTVCATLDEAAALIESQLDGAQ